MLGKFGTLFRYISTMFLVLDMCMWSMDCVCGLWIFFSLSVDMRRLSNNNILGVYVCELEQKH
jgi:hypothetical protein